MPRMPTPICVRQLYTSLLAVRDRLTEDARITTDYALADTSEDALALMFTQLSTSSILIFLTDGAYQIPVEHPGQPSTARKASPRWLAYAAHAESPLVQVDHLPNLRGGRAIAADARPSSLAETLMCFHFFSGLEPILPQITAGDADLSAKLRELQTLGDSFRDEFDGYKLNLDRALAVALATDGVVNVELALDQDEFYPESQAVPAARRLPYERTAILLGRNLEIARGARVLAEDDRVQRRDRAETKNSKDARPSAKMN